MQFIIQGDFSYWESQNSHCNWVPAVENHGKSCFIDESNAWNKVTLLRELSFTRELCLILVRWGSGRNSPQGDFLVLLFWKLSQVGLQEIYKDKWGEFCFWYWGRWGSTGVVYSLYLLHQYSGSRLNCHVVITATVFWSLQRLSHSLSYLKHLDQQCSTKVPCNA